MILQALAEYYDRLVEKGTLQKPGWQDVKVHYALGINKDGQLVRLIPLMSSRPNGKKEVMEPKVLHLPELVKRSSGVLPNFLCDNAAYILGADNKAKSEKETSKGKPERARLCFEASRDLHIRLLRSVDTPAAQAIVRYFETWDPDTAREHPVFKDDQDIFSGANITFYFGDSDITTYPEICRAWDEAYADNINGEVMRCLVTGDLAPVARLHPSIKGVMGGQSSGTSLVSFNAPAYESYGRAGEQGLNAPVSQRAAFAYTAALNYMTGTERRHVYIGDMTVVFWTDNGEEAYCDILASLMDDELMVHENDLFDALVNLARGHSAPWNDKDLSPNTRFCILGLSPNAARLSIRFFLQNTFENLAKNTLKFQKELKIERPKYDQKEHLGIRDILNQTKRLPKDKALPLAAGALTRSVLEGTPYPESLYQLIEIRIRAGDKITRERAAMIKAYLIRNTKDRDDYWKYKEAVEKVTLDQNTTYVPYLLGRLFAVLECLQRDAAAPAKLNTTIRDKYFNSACATPAVVFNQLIKLAQAHLRKIRNSTTVRVDYDALIGQILAQITNDYPSRLDLRDQGIFQLGYYHQIQKYYTSNKEEKENV